MGMPQLTSGTTPAAAAWNVLATEIDNLGVCVKVRRTAPLSITNTTDTVVPWQTATFDTRGDQWSLSFPTMVTIQIAGTYALTLQERWSPSGGNGTGQRAGKIMVNGTSVFANSIASNIQLASSTGEGTTLNMSATARLYRGDQIYVNAWHSAGTTITGLNIDYGGTALTVNRVGPLAL